MNKGSFLLLDGLEVPFLHPRSVRVFLPSGFHPSQARPSLWLFDGQNVFGDEGSFSGGGQVEEAVDRLGARTFTAPVVVGIDHGGSQRIEELSPFPHGQNGTASKTIGKANFLLDWLVVTLMPRLRDQLGIAAGPKGVVIGGSSMGGLAALYAHFRHPEAFGGALCMSPSLWFGKRAIFDFVKVQSIPWTSRLYFDCGVKEGRGAMITVVESMVEHLRQRGYQSDRLLFRADPKGSHAEVHWRRRFPKALRFMFHQP
ncbi:MAG: hypothetical protein NVS3B20_20390 [Polyangiales bacterium]